MMPKSDEPHPIKSNAKPVDRLVVKGRVQRGDPQTLAAYLRLKTNLSLTQVNNALEAGAVWLGPQGRSGKRIRKGSHRTKVGDRVEIYYDEAILTLVPPKATLLRDFGRYSVWYKPPGLMTQGSRFGDHCALLRYAELFFKSKRSVYMVHRLDREADGLILLAHHVDAAGQLSQLFQNREVFKQYRIVVLGQLKSKGFNGDIRELLDGKEALTLFKVLDVDSRKNRSTVLVTLKTGRRHQIRRHFEAIGYPVMGDPLYGTGNKNQEGMQLTAIKLGYACPMTRQQVLFTLHEKLRLQVLMTDQGGVAS